MINLTILAENRANGKFAGQAGLSVLVNAFGNSLILDTGLSKLYTKNAKKAKINLKPIETVVLTHGHSDHTGGLCYLSKGKTIIAHPEIFRARWSIRQQNYAGCPMSEKKMIKKHNFVSSTSAYKVFENCYFLGEIPMTVDFEKEGNFSTTLDDKFTQVDDTIDDSGIAITTEKGLFVMTGCGHRGICNTIEHAKKVTGQNKLWGAFGGFHLRNLDKQKHVIDQTIQYFKDNDLQVLYLGHCVKDFVIDYFKQQLPNVKIETLASGKQFDIDLNPLT